MGPQKGIASQHLTSETGSASTFAVEGRDILPYAVPAQRKRSSTGERGWRAYRSEDAIVKHVRAPDTELSSEVSRTAPSRPGTDQELFLR